MMRAQKGDTVVEVLIAIAVVALVLAGAFAATRKGQITSQRTEERNQATKYLEQQTERLKLQSSNPVLFGPALSNAANCIDDSFSLQTGAPCTYDSRYEVYFVRVAGTANTFQISVEWDPLAGNEGNARETATAFYKAYQQ